MNCPACDTENTPGDDLCRDCGLDLAGLDATAWGVSPEDPVLAVRLSALPLKTPLVLAPDATSRSLRGPCPEDMVIERDLGAAGRFRHR